MSFKKLKEYLTNSGIYKKQVRKGKKIKPDTSTEEDRDSVTAFEDEINEEYEAAEKKRKKKQNNT